MIIRRAGLLISQIHQVSARLFNRILQNEGIDEINGAQGRILFALWEENAVPISTLVKKTMLDKSTLTGMLDRLEKDGFVSRSPSAEDRRVVLIRRTEKDRNFQKKYIAVSERMTTIFYEGLSEKEIDKFEKTLEHVLKNCVDQELTK